MKLITLSDFQGATGLSNDSIMWLIKNNKVNMEYSKAKGLMVDAELINKNELVEAMIQSETNALTEERALTKEKIALIISNKLQEVLDIALLKA